ncbi:MAG: hypothetical protein N4A71_24530 [Carboxylicivirga sp.]|jgi:predicted transcriptional regulator|nr:hypothetical protein [Carboxylicivirga sp.]MCT4644937.1 hypothetical protein [Carboxylicivirga sp.]
MPRIRKPLSAIDRLVFLKKAVNTANIESGEKMISEKTLGQANAVIAPLEANIGELANQKSESQKEIREKNTAMSNLQTYVRDIWEGIRRRVYREQLPLDVFPYYQLPKNGTSPKLASEGQWLEVAGLIIKGEASAIANGYAPMSNPSVDELGSKLKEAKKESADVTIADQKLDASQEAVSDLMPEAVAAIDRIIAELNFNLYDKDDASKRRIMRNYGVRYELTTKEEAEDATDVSLN